MKRNLLVLLGIILFIAGPTAKVYDLAYDHYYLVFSLLGLILLTVLAFKKNSN